MKNNSKKTPRQQRMEMCCWKKCVVLCVVMFWHMPLGTARNREEFQTVLMAW